MLITGPIIAKNYTPNKTPLNSVVYVQKLRIQAQWNLLYKYILLQYNSGTD